MRLLSVAFAAVLACHGGAPAPDAAPEVATTSFDRPIGTACKAIESALCASGIGICHRDMCRAFCSAVEHPRCDGGMIEVHDTVDDRDICLCTPP